MRTIEEHEEQLHSLLDKRDSLIKKLNRAKSILKNAGIESIQGEAQVIKDMVDARVRLTAVEDDIVLVEGAIRQLIKKGEL